MRNTVDVENEAKNLMLLNDKILEAAQMKKAFEQMEEALDKKKEEVKALMSRLGKKKHVYKGIEVKFVSKSSNTMDIKKFKELVNNEDVFMSCVKLKSKEAKAAVPAQLHHEFITPGVPSEEFHLTLPKAEVIV